MKNKVTHISIREAFTDTYVSDAGARKAFEDCKSEGSIVFASLHIGGKLVEIYDNTEDLELDGAPEPKRIKITDELGNVSYVHRGPNSGIWSCTLANGIPATFFYAVGNCDETALRFRLADAESDDERLQIITALAGPRRKVEFFS